MAFLSQMLQLLEQMCNFRVNIPKQDGWGDRSVESRTVWTELRRGTSMTTEVTVAGRGVFLGLGSERDETGFVFEVVHDLILWKRNISFGGF